MRNAASSRRLAGVAGAGCRTRRGCGYGCTRREPATRHVGLGGPRGSRLPGRPGVRPAWQDWQAPGGHGRHRGEGGPGTALRGDGRLDVRLHGWFHGWFHGRIHGRVGDPTGSAAARGRSSGSAADSCPGPRQDEGVLMTSLTRSPQRHRDGVGLGTETRIVVTDPAVLDEAAAFLQHRIADLDMAASRFRTDSELSWANRHPGSPVRVGATLRDAMAESLAMAEATNGLVDPAVGADVVAAGYDRSFELLPALPALPALSDGSGPSRVPAYTVTEVPVEPRPTWRDVVLTRRTRRVRRTQGEPGSRFPGGAASIWAPSPRRGSPTPSRSRSRSAGGAASWSSSGETSRSQAYRLRAAGSSGSPGQSERVPKPSRSGPAGSLPRPRTGVAGRRPTGPPTTSSTRGPVVRRPALGGRSPCTLRRPPRQTPPRPPR